MTQLILVSHGPLAAGVAAAAEMILGPFEGVHVIGLQPSQGPDTLTAAVEEVLASLAGEPAILMTDLIGGTPFNVCARISQQRGVPVTTGLNLPMLLTALTERQAPVAELEGVVTEAGRDGVRSLAAELRSRAASQPLD